MGLYSLAHLASLQCCLLDTIPASESFQNRYTVSIKFFLAALKSISALETNKLDLNGLEQLYTYP